MRRRDKAGGKPIKTQRIKTLKRVKASKIARRRKSIATGKETNVERLTRQLAGAVTEQEQLTQELLRREAYLVVGMNPLKEFFESGQTILWIETQNTVAFLRPVRDILLWAPCPTACLAESLRLRVWPPIASEARRRGSASRWAYSDLWLILPIKHADGSGVAAGWAADR
jgi:hypothetical protein